MDDTAYLSEIKLFAGDFAPRGWALCYGQLLPIASYDALFSLIGTQYGGDGRTTFGLPDMRGRAPIGAGTGPGLSPRAAGQRSGTESVSLELGQMPAHSHTLSVQVNPHWMASTSQGNQTQPQNGSMLAAGHFTRVQEHELENYAPPETTPTVTLGGAVANYTPALATNGGSLPHSNVQPFQVLNYIICIEGIYPSRD